MLSRDSGLRGPLQATGRRVEQELGPEARKAGVSLAILGESGHGHTVVLRSDPGHSTHYSGVGTRPGVFWCWGADVTG